MHTTRHTPDSRSKAGGASRLGREQIRHRNEVVLELEYTLFSEQVLRGLIDDWIAPAIVDRIVSECLNSSEGTRE